jgi:hypothetical protein
MRISEGGAEIRFSTFLGKEYQLEASLELTGPWEAIGEVIPGDGTTQTAVDPERDHPHRYFRVIQSP